LSFVLLRYLVRLILDNHLCNIVQVATGHIYIMLLGSTSAKAARKTLMKSTPGVLIFINILRTNFSYECHFGSFFYVHVTRKAAETTFIQKTRAKKSLTKVTPGVLNFINILRSGFFVVKQIEQLFSQYVRLCNFLVPKYWQKSCA